MIIAVLMSDDVHSNSKNQLVKLTGDKIPRALMCDGLCNHEFDTCEDEANCDGYRYVVMNRLKLVINQ